MVEQRRLVQRAYAGLGPVAWSFVSLALHALVFMRSCDVALDFESERPFQLPAEVEFGIASHVPGGGDARQEPPAAAAPAQPIAKRRRVKVAPDPEAYAAATSQRAEQAAPKASNPQATPAANTGEGAVPDALGSGLGEGMGPGSGYAPAGATIALNVDLQRVRKTALVLETEALLDIIPQWQPLLAGSGIDPMKDLDRVFVASPTLQRSSVVVAATHHLRRPRLEAAVAQLAREQGKPASFRSEGGYEVAPWRNRGPTDRSIALTARGQLTITRTGDLPRVLQVADALAQMRQGQGFAAEELDAHGGFLAMEHHEAVALWVEGLAKYLRSDVRGLEALPGSIRLSLLPVDQFNTELRVHAQYASASAASEALATMDALRLRLAEHPKVTFLGLKSAFEHAAIEQERAALRMEVRLTLHQTRHLMRYVTRALRPRRSR